jgi:phage terminase large subunit-like protein
VSQVARLPRITARGRNRALDVANLGEHWLTHGKGGYGGQPFVLEAWQWQDIILPLYGRLDHNGRRWYDRALIIVPRWNGKTETGSLMVDNSLFLEPVDEGEVYAVATTLKQAGVAFRTVKSGIMRNRELRSMVEVSKKEIVVKASQATFQALPHDADTAQGFHASFALIDELHVHKSPDMLNAMLSGMIGFDEPLLVAITTVGELEDGVWWDVYQEWKNDPHALVVFYGAKKTDDPHDPATWRKANPAAFLTDEMLLKAYNRLPFSSFCRYHLNLPSSGTIADGAIDLSRWRKCKTRPKLDRKAPCIIGVDASLRRDETAVVLDQRDLFGFHNVYAWFFAGEGALGERPVVDQEKVRDLIMALCNTYNVTRVPCDPAYFRESMDLLEAEGIPVEVFEQHPRVMAPASQSLLDVVSKRKLRHGGDAHLEDHVLAAVVRETGWGWRLDKPNHRTHIDGAIALAIAVHCAEADAREGDGSFVAAGGARAAG